MNVVNDLQLGKRIKQLREKEKMSQHDLFEKIGISTTQLSAYENGKRSIGLHTIIKIASAFGVSIDELYYGSPSLRPINVSNNKGELIVNCIAALFDEGVVAALVKEEENEYVAMGVGYYYQIGFNKYVDILDDMVKKLDDFEKNKLNYPDPEGFKKQILASAIKQINDRSKLKAK